MAYGSVKVDSIVTSTQTVTVDNLLESADIGVTVQGYDADTAKYDDATANFTGTLQNGGSDVVVDSDIGVTVQAYDADTAKLDVAQAFTALQVFNTIAVGQSSVSTNVDIDINGTYAQTVQTVSALDIDCGTGNYFIKTINANSTFTFSNVPPSRAYSFVLELTHTSGSVSWPAAVKWPADTAPTLTAGKTHLFVFVTDDSGSRWRGAALVDYVN